MSEHGRIIGVTEKPLGSTLVGDTPAGATSLTVVDAAEFDDQASGSLTINDQVIAYSGVNDNTGVITLKSGSTLAVTADEGDKVLLYDPLYEDVAVDKRALVVLDGADDNSDAIDASIALHLVDKLDTGLRGDDGESVILEDDQGEWRVVDILGLGNPDMTGIKFEADDIYVLTAGDIAAGTATFQLSHRPMKEGMVAFWRTTPQEPTEYSVDYDAQTVTWPLEGFEKASDRLWVHYAYRRGFAIPTLVTPTFVDSASAVSPGGAVTVTIPATVQAGDLLIAVQGKQANGPGAWTVPAGWSLLTPDAVVEASFKVAFSRVAGAGDAGSPVTFTTGEPDSPLFGGAGVALAVYRNAQIAAISPVTAGSGAGLSGIATAASVTSPAEALVLGLWGATSASSTGITPSDLTRAAALAQRGAAAISERAVSAGPSGITTANVGGAQFSCWQVALVQK